MKKFWIWLRCFVLGHGRGTNYHDLENHPAWTYLWTCSLCGRRLATTRLYDFTSSGGIARPQTTTSVNPDTEKQMIEAYAKEK